MAESANKRYRTRDPFEIMTPHILLKDFFEPESQWDSSPL
jgi:hypothetical protein